MPGKTNVYNLGEKGINVTTSPIHLEDGELTSGQNAVFDPKGEEGGLRKRDGMTKLNSVAAGSGGAIKGFVSLPLPAPDTFLTKTLYAALGSADSNNFLTSTDGTTWAATTTPSTPYAAGVGSTGRFLTFNRKLWYPGNQFTQYPAAGNTPPIIRVYDGTNDLEAVKVPYSATSGVNALYVEDMCAHNGFIAFCVIDYGGTTPNIRGRVFMLDPYTYQVEQVGNAFGAGTGENTGGAPVALCSYGGYLWAGTWSETAGSAMVGKIWKIRAGVEETWTLDLTTATGQGDIVALGVYNGLLYASVTGNDVTPASEAGLVLVRATTGAWTTADTSAITDDGAYYAHQIVFENNLYVASFGSGGANAFSLIRKYDGSSWTTAYDIEANVGVQAPGQPAIFKSNLYWPVCATATGASDGAILKLASGGGWSIVTTGKNIQGAMAQLAVET
jgi:hypothetical protein